MELFSIISSACYNQFPKQNGSGLRNEILKCMSIPTPRSYTPGCTINPYKNCSRINTYKFYWAEGIWIKPYKNLKRITIDSKTRFENAWQFLHRRPIPWEARLIPTKIDFSQKFSIDFLVPTNLGPKIKKKSIVY